jgi:predicted nucleic acid-binding protein
MIRMSDYFRAVRARFDFPRDPRDAMLIELAISAKATDIVSADNDLRQFASKPVEGSLRAKSLAGLVP